MKRGLIVLIGVLLVLSLACGGSGGGSGMQVTVNNRSSQDLCYVYISPASSDSWGDDKLGSDTLAAGSSKTFDVSQDTYDIMVQDCSGATVYSDSDVSSNTTIDIGGSGEFALRLENQSSDEVCYVFISSSDADSWGDDWMGAKESVASGGARVFYVTSGTYDVQAQDCDNTELASEYGVDLSRDVTWTISD